MHQSNIILQISKSKDANELQDVQEPQITDSWHQEFNPSFNPS